MVEIVDQSQRQKRLEEYLKLISPDEGLESLKTMLPADETGLESMGGPLEARYELVEKATKKMRDGATLSPEETSGLEAIIHEDGRPAYLIQDDKFQASGIWQGLGTGSNRDSILAAIPNVGRIEMPGVSYVGTGFVVGEGLIMTNRHVADDFCQGIGQHELKFITGLTPSIDFKREHERETSINIVMKDVVMIHPYWDVALLRVEGLPEGRAPLQLSTEDPGHLVNRDIVVIGYPAKNYRQDTQMQDRVFNSIYKVKRLQPGKLHERMEKRSFQRMVNSLTHDSSTLGGNSGSMVFDFANNKVVGVHYSGFELKRNYAVPTYELARDRRVVDLGVQFDGELPATQDWVNAWRFADLGEEETMVEPKAEATPDTVSGTSSSDASASTNEIKLTVPLEITISVNVTSPTSSVDRVVSVGAESGEEAVRFPIKPDPNYARRRGYNPAFLGPGFEIRLPWLTDEQYRNTVENQLAERDSHLLHYYHFTLVMNRERKLAYYTACNIDGKREKHISRDDISDKWIKDPRIEKDEQQVNDLYKSNPLDRGHLVRRLDPVWGEFSTAKKAHDDTFHWTNCSPQHKDFNRNKSTWGQVENWILDRAHAKNLRLTVFTGPVFLPNDPIFRFGNGKKVRLPLSYWKIVAMVNQAGELVTSAYLVKQNSLIDDMLEAVEEPKSFQKTVKEIERLTQLDFYHLRDHDAKKSDGEESLGDDEKPLDGFEDIVL